MLAAPNVWMTPHVVCAWVDTTCLQVRVSPVPLYLDVHSAILLPTVSPAKSAIIWKWAFVPHARPFPTASTAPTNQPAFFATLDTSF